MNDKTKTSSRGHLLRRFWLACLLAGSTTAGAQQYQWVAQFGTTGDDSANSVAVYADGIYVAGDLSGVDGFVRRYDAQGKLVWKRAFGGRAGDVAYAVFADAAGVYAGGSTTAPPANDLNPDVLVIKYDLAGHELWRRQFGRAGPDDATGVAADATGVYVVGSYSFGDAGGYIYKFSQDGTALWTHDFRTLGGSYNDFATGVAVDATGVYMTGVKSDPAMAPGLDAWDAFVTRYDTDGNELWSRTFGTPVNDRAFAIGVGRSGIYVVGGTLGRFPGERSYGYYDAFIRKYDADGNAQWTRQFGSGGLDWALGVAVSHQGAYVVGYTAGTLPSVEHYDFGHSFVRAYDADGDEHWTVQNYTDNVVAAAAGKGGLYVTGSTTSAFGQPIIGGHDAYLMKFPLADGDQAFVRWLGDINGDRIPDLAVVTPDGHAQIKGLDGRLVSQFDYVWLHRLVDVAVLPDSNGNGVPELLVLSDGGTVSTHVEARDALTGERVSFVDFRSYLGPLEFELVADQNGNGVPEVAVLGQFDHLVDVWDPVSGDPLSNIYYDYAFDGKDLAVYPDLDRNGAPNLSLLMENRNPANADKLEVRDYATAQVVDSIWLGKGWSVLRQALIGDLNGNGYGEAAVLRVRDSDGAVNVVIRDTKTGKPSGSIGFDRNYPPTQLLSLSDINGNGADEVVVFGQRYNGGNQKAQIRDSKTGALIRAVFFDRQFPGQDLRICPDLNGNGAGELVLLGKRPDDGKLKVMVKDAKTGTQLGAVNF